MSKKQDYQYHKISSMNPQNIVTDRQLKVSFDDETGSIIISTPRGNLIELNDDLNILKLSDSYQNSITMDQHGIQIFSYKDITISGLNINVKASMNIDSKATMDISSSAINIHQHAELNFTAQGNANAELSSGIQTVVKGTIVMIN